MVKKTVVFIVLVTLIMLVVSCSTSTQIPPQAHPQSNDWQAVFEPDLSNAIYPEGIWTFKMAF